MTTPTCNICKQSVDVQFDIFNPAIPPFGTTCVACEEEVKESLAFLGIDAKPADCDICENGEVWHGLVQINPQKETGHVNGNH
jgi:hypothetical protein